MKEVIAGPAGRLQLVVESPSAQPRALALSCHPHPLHGGSLTNKVVHQLARSFVELGAVSVRFNFRGVGDSEGVFDNGAGETDDLQAVAARALDEWPGLPLWLAGFSFGAYVALRAADKLNPGWLLTVAPPVNMYDFSSLQPAVRRWLLIQGEDDEIVPGAAVKAWAGGLARPPERVTLDGAGHFFHGRLNDLKQVVLERAPV